MHNFATHYSPMLYANMHAQKKIMHMHKRPRQTVIRRGNAYEQAVVSTDHCQPASKHAMNNHRPCITSQPITAQCFTSYAPSEKNKCIGITVRHSRACHW